MRTRLIGLAVAVLVVAGVVSAVVVVSGGGEEAEPVAVEVAEEPQEVAEEVEATAVAAAEEEVEADEAEAAEVEEAEPAPEPAEEEQVAEQPDASAAEVEQAVAEVEEAEAEVEPAEETVDEEPAAPEPAEEAEPEVALAAIVPIPLSASGRPVPVVGPLLVFTGPVPVGVARTRREPGQAIRRVSLYDMETDQYWDAFDYSPRRQWNHQYERWDYSYDYDKRLGVQVAGTQLILWSMDQIVRVTLNGQIETVLFEDADIQAFAVSPDGAHVAILYGLSGTLIVLDAATGAERLRITNNAPVIKALGGVLDLGHWQVDGTAITLTNVTRKVVSPPLPTGLGRLGVAAADRSACRWSPDRDHWARRHDAGPAG